MSEREGKTGKERESERVSMSHFNGIDFERECAECGHMANTFLNRARVLCNEGVIVGSSNEYLMHKSSGKFLSIIHICNNIPFYWQIFLYLYISCSICLFSRLVQDIPPVGLLFYEKHLCH